jgi:hypothetical protein
MARMDIRIFFTGVNWFVIRPDKTKECLMNGLGFKDESRSSEQKELISLDKLAELTGFPVEFIKTELFLSSDESLTLEELRVKALNFLESEF